MRYFLLTADMVDFPFLYTDDRSVDKLFSQGCWTREEALRTYEFTLERDKRTIHDIGDFTYLKYQIPILSERAASELKEYFEASGTFVPLRVAKSKARLYAYCVSAFESALDMDKSKCLYFSSGELMYIERPVLRKNFVATREVFMLNESPVLGLVISQNVRSRIEAERLTGYVLEDLPYADSGE